MRQEPFVKACFTALLTAVTIASGVLPAIYPVIWARWVFGLCYAIGGVTVLILCWELVKPTWLRNLVVFFACIALLVGFVATSGKFPETPGPNFSNAMVTRLFISPDPEYPLQSDALVWVSIQNTGQDSTILHWWLSIKTVDGTPVASRLIKIDDKSRLWLSEDGRVYRSDIKPEAQLWGRYLTEPVLRDHGALGFLVFRLNHPPLGDIDVPSSHVSFADNKGHVWKTTDWVRLRGYNLHETDPGEGVFVPATPKGRGKP